MKRAIWAVAGVGALIVLVCVNRPKSPAVSPQETVVEPATEQTTEHQVVRSQDLSPKTEPDWLNRRAQPPGRERDQPVKTGQAALVSSTEADGKLLLDQAIQTLVSPQAGFEQKQAAWKQLN